MIDNPPRFAPRWLTPEMVIKGTPLDGLDILQQYDVRLTRVALLCAVARTQLRDLGGFQS